MSCQTHRYIAREWLSVAAACEAAGTADGPVPVRTMRRWIVEQEIGRKVAGEWRVSLIGLAMLLAGDDEALARFRRGDRTSSIVIAYYTAAGLGDVPSLLAA